MNNYKNKNLKKFVDYYYKCENYTLPSRKDIAIELSLTEAEVRTFISYFELCNYIYKDGKAYKLYNVKRDFETFYAIQISNNYVTYKSKDFVISFNILELELLQPNFIINTLEDLVYILFLFNMKKNIIVHSFFYTKNCYA